MDFWFITLIVLKVVNNLFCVHCQICSLDHGKLPQDWKCDDEPHIISQDQEEINSYCGYSISSTLVAK